MSHEQYDDEQAKSFLRKPAKREACNGCGLCCATQYCTVAEMVFPESVDTGAEWTAKRCPALEWDDGRFWSGLVRDPAKYVAPHWPPSDHTFADETLRGPLTAMVGVGHGCGMDDEDMPAALIQILNQVRASA